MSIKSLLTLFIISVVIIGCDTSLISVNPSDTISTKEFPVSAYSGLNVSSAFEVNVEFSDREESIIIETNDNIHQYVNVSNEDNTLYIGLDNILFVRGNATLKAYIKTKSISDYSASGASHIQVQDTIEAENVTVDLSGASYFHAEFATEEINADLSGASNIDASGSVVDYFVSASGASEIRDYSLSADFLEVELSGASTMYVSANKEIIVDASGASTLYYKGEASIVSQDLSGASNVVKKD